MAEDYSQIEKSISFFINQQFPAIYREDGPELVQLARDYYKWMETATNQSTYVSRRFFEYKDIDTTIKSLLIFFKNKYLVDLELKESIVPFLVKNILDLYRRKGTKAGIELFFATFYKEFDIEVVYPSNKMLKASNSEWKTGNFLQMLPNDNLFTSSTTGIQYTYADLISRVITGSVTQAQASVTKINSILINGIYTPIIYIDNVNGVFNKFDHLYTNINGEQIDFGTVGGSLSGFKVDDSQIRTPDNQIGDSVVVNAARGVGGEGIVTDITSFANTTIRLTYEDGGYGYTLANTNLIISEQAINTDASNQVQFEAYERLTDTNGNEAYVVGQNAYNIGVKFTNKVDAEGFDQTRAISTLDRNPNIDLKLSGIQIGVSSFNNTSPGITYPEGTQDANTEVYAVLTNVETVNLITDAIQPHLATTLNAADYEANAPMSGSASPVTLATTLNAAFDVSGIDIGKIQIFENFNPGFNYDFDVFARAKDDVISKFKKRGQIIRLATPTEIVVFSIGETITEQGTSVTGQITAIDSVNGLLYVLPNAWDGFSGSNDIIRQINLDVFNIAGVSDDYSGRVYGDNAVIDAKVEYELGYINEVAITNSGFSYVDGDPGTIRDPSDTSIVLASGTIEARTQGKNKGYWKDFSSHINGYVTEAANSAAIDSYYNSGMRIQDSDFYQEYSYQIKSTLDKSQYEKLLKENVHLAGAKMFGDFVYKADITSGTKARFIRFFNDQGSGSVLDQANTSLLEASVTNFTVDSSYVTADHIPGGSGGANLSALSDLTITKTWSQGIHDYDVTIGMPTVGTAPYPVAILLHGAGGNGAGMVAQNASVLPGHILLGVQGYGNTWNISNETSNGPDIEMLNELIDSVKPYANVDQSKIRILGFSNGGALALRAAIEITDSAVDVIICGGSQTNDDQYRGGQFYKPSNEEQTGDAYANDGYDTLVSTLPQRKIIQYNGTNDTVIPYNGGAASWTPLSPTFLSAPNSVYAFAQAQGYSGSQSSGTSYGTNSFLVDYGDVIFLNDAVGHTTSADHRNLVNKYLEDNYSITY